MSTELTETRERSLMRSTGVVAFMTFISRMLGFVRDMLVARFFGADAGMDAFVVAFKIPNFMRRLFAEGAFSQAFVPVLAEYQKTGNFTETRDFIARIAGTLGVILTIVTLLGILLAPIVIMLFAPGFKADGARFILATEMLRLTFPYLMLISLTAMAGAVLNTFGYFGPPAFTPVFLNISIIVAAIFLSPHLAEPILALAIGVLVAGIIQLLFQIPFLYRRNLLKRPELAWRDPGVMKVVKLMVPALFGVSIAQINLLVDTIFASFLPVGSVSWLFFTDRLADFPLGVFGVAIATVILPHLSRHKSAGNVRQFSAALDWGLRLLLLAGIPSAVGLILFGIPLVASCFGYGEFSLQDVIQTRYSLITLALGVPGFMLVKVLASGFYAGQNIRTPVMVGVIAMVANTVLCALLIWPLAHAGLALASSLAGYLNCAILLVLLIRRKIYQPQSGWLRFAGQILAANLTMGMYLMLANPWGAEWWMAKSVTIRPGLTLIHVTVAAMIYVGTLFACGVRLKNLQQNI